MDHSEGVLTLGNDQTKKTPLLHAKSATTEGRSDDALRWHCLDLDCFYLYGLLGPLQTNDKRSGLASSG